MGYVALEVLQEGVHHIRLVVHRTLRHQQEVARHILHRRGVLRSADRSIC